MDLYKEDIETEGFEDELRHFLHFIKSHENNQHSPVEMYQIVQDGLSGIFPNVETILKIILTLPVSNASAERSFSALKRVKNYLRTTLTEEHLNSLSILAIESTAFDKLDYDIVINDFIDKKCRKKFV